MNRLRPVLLGALAAVLPVALGGTAPTLLRWPGAPAAGEPLPLPPESPRFDNDPFYDACLARLRQDPQEALASAEAWEAAGGGEGAKHCAALSLLAIGETEKAAERLEQLARVSQATAAARAAVYAQAVQAWMLANQSGRAYAAATMGLTIAPADLDLMLDRAVALGTLGRYADALPDLDQIVAADPGRAEAWVFRAAALRHLDRPGPAATAVERALALAPNNAEALLERGIIRQSQGDRRGARADWERAITLSPGSPAAELAQQNLALDEDRPRRR